MLAATSGLVEATSPPSGSGASRGLMYLLGRRQVDRDALFRDFEALFPGGSDDAAQLDLAVLAQKPDFDHAVIDCLMCE